MQQTRQRPRIGGHNESESFLFIADVVKVQNSPKEKRRSRDDADRPNYNCNTVCRDVSPEFAAQCGFQIEKPDAQHREVILADGSRAAISGHFRARFDTFDRTSKAKLLCGSSSPRNIFKNLNLVTWLSRNEKRLLRLLSDTTAASSSSHPSSAGTASAGVATSLVSRDPSAALEVAFQLELDEDGAREQRRRQIANREIARLPEPEKSRRKAAEDSRRQTHDRDRARRLREHNARMAAVATQNRNTNASNNVSGSTP
ncbi:hypothetical protein VTN00DRAFT_1939 [Thermoascus crustaceus]|uniref:uncharacterized protein n=1 Tax=Thermoascus crustaceus TaxID=5088 RepID=UPI0037427D98